MNYLEMIYEPPPVVKPKPVHPIDIYSKYDLNRIPSLLGDSWEIVGLQSLELGDKFITSSGMLSYCGALEADVGLIRYVLRKKITDTDRLNHMLKNYAVTYRNRDEIDEAIRDED